MTFTVLEETFQRRNREIRAPAEQNQKKLGKDPHPAKYRQLGSHVKIQMEPFCRREVCKGGLVPTVQRGVSLLLKEKGQRALLF